MHHLLPRKYTKHSTNVGLKKLILESESRRRKKDAKTPRDPTRLQSWKGLPTELTRRGTTPFPIVVKRPSFVRDKASQVDDYGCSSNTKGFVGVKKSSGTARIWPHVHCLPILRTLGKKVLFSESEMLLFQLVIII